MTTVRSVRSSVNIPAAAKITLKVKDATEAQRKNIEDNAAILKSLAKVEDIQFVSETGAGEVAQVVDGMTLLIPLAGLIDVAKEKERVTKEMQNVQAFVERTKAQLANEAFVSKAPEQVVADKRKALADSEQDIAKMQEILKLLGA